jgi:hypothetical protein
VAGVATSLPKKQQLYFLRTKGGYLSMQEDAEAGVFFAGGQPFLRLGNGQGIVVNPKRAIPPTAYHRSDLEFTSEMLEGRVCCRLTKGGPLSGPLSPLPEYSGKPVVTGSVMARIMARRAGKLHIRSAKAQVKQAESKNAVSLKTLFEMQTLISALDERRKQGKAKRTCDMPGCLNSGVKLCSRCRDASYCSVECNRAAWPSHKARCAPWDS